MCRPTRSRMGRATMLLSGGSAASSARASPATSQLSASSHLTTPRYTTRLGAITRHHTALHLSASPHCATVRGTAAHGTALLGDSPGRYNTQLGVSSQQLTPHLGDNTRHLNGTARRQHATLHRTAHHARSRRRFTSRRHTSLQHSASYFPFYDPANT